MRIRLTQWVFTAFVFFLVKAGAVYSEEAVMPFGLPIEPNSSFHSGGTHEKAGGDRLETVIYYATTSSPQQVLAFYQPALEKAGFLMSLPKDRGDYVAFSGKRDSDRIRISAKRTSHPEDPGPVEITIVAEYDKQ